MKIELPFEDQPYAIDELIRFPPIVLSAYSLTPMEKMIAGTMLMLVRPKVVVELGVLKARTSDFICQFLKLNDIDATLYGFDLPDQSEELRTENPIAQRLEETGQMVLIPGFLPDSLTDWLATHDKPIDFALVDALHRFPNVTRELEIIWSRLAPNGVILCHDYDHLEENEGVRYAVDRFAQRTPDAQMVSFFRHSGLPDLPEQFTPEIVSNYTYASTLAVIRRRPLPHSDDRLAQYLEEDRRWRMERGEIQQPVETSRMDQVKDALRNTPLYGLARGAKRLIRG